MQTHYLLTHTHTCTQHSSFVCAEHRQAIELSEQRRQLDMQDHAFREEARHRQAHHLAEVAALNREVCCACCVYLSFSCFVCVCVNESEEARHRQAHHLAEVAALNRKVCFLVV